jgi:hypothetical protein
MESGTSTAKKCAISEFIKEKDVLVCVTRKGLRSLIQAATKKPSTKILKNIIENCNAHEKCRKKYVTKNKVVLFKKNWITTEKTSENFVLSPFVSFYFPRWLHPNLGIGSIFNKITSTTLHSHCTHHIPKVKLGKTVFN